MVTPKTIASASLWLGCLQKQKKNLFGEDKGCGWQGAYNTCYTGSLRRSSETSVRGNFRLVRMILLKQLSRQQTQLHVVVGDVGCGCGMWVASLPRTEQTRRLLPHHLASAPNPRPGTLRPLVPHINIAFLKNSFYC